jgi:hypothetical protein
MRMLFILILVLWLVSSAGCQPTVDQSDSPDPNLKIGETATVSKKPSEAIIVPDAATPVQTPDKMETPMKKNLERVPPENEPTPVTGEVPPELLNSILDDLTNRTGVAPKQVSIIRGQAVVWNDGSLGCPKPGMMYTQALVNGYWVELEVAGQRFDYRVSDTGYFFLCESGMQPGFVPVTPDS